MKTKNAENSVGVYVLAGVLFCALVLCGFWFMGEVEEEAERVVAKSYENAPKVGEFCEISGRKLLFRHEAGVLQLERAGDELGELLRAEMAAGRAWGTRSGELYKVLKINKKNMTVLLKSQHGKTGWTMLRMCTRVSHEEVARRVQQACER